MNSAERHLVIQEVFRRLVILMAVALLAGCWSDADQEGFEEQLQREATIIANEAESGYLDPKTLAEEGLVIATPEATTTEIGEIFSTQAPDFIDSKHLFTDVPIGEILSVQINYLLNNILKIPLDRNILEKGGAYFNGSTQEGVNVLAIELAESQEETIFHSPVSGTVIAVEQEITPNFNRDTITIEYGDQDSVIGRLFISFSGQSLVEEGDKVSVGQPILAPKMATSEIEGFYPTYSSLNYRADVVLQDYIQSAGEAEKFIPRGMGIQNVLRVIGEIEGENGEESWVVIDLSKE